MLACLRASCRSGVNYDSWNTATFLLNYTHIESYCSAVLFLVIIYIVVGPLVAQAGRVEHTHPTHTSYMIPLPAAAAANLIAVFLRGQVCRYNSFQLT